MFNDRGKQLVVMLLFTRERKRDFIRYMEELEDHVRQFVRGPLKKALKNHHVDMEDRPWFSSTYGDEEYFDIHVDIYNSYHILTKAMVTIPMNNFVNPIFMTWNEGDEEKEVRFTDKDFQ